MLGNISIADNIYIVTGYTDMRKSIDGLCAMILNQMKTGPDSHAIYFFCGEYYGAAEPPVRCGESHLSGLTEPPRFFVN